MNKDRNDRCVRCGKLLVGSDDRYCLRCHMERNKKTDTVLKVVGAIAGGAAVAGGLIAAFGGGQSSYNDYSDNYDDSEDDEDDEDDVD